MVCQKIITHEDSINNFVSISEYIENGKCIPAELKGKFKVPNLPLHIHTEGPFLADHLQAMLNVLNNPEQLSDEYGEYKKILMEPKNKEFFIYFILWHDIAKTIIEPSTIVEEGKELSLYPKHERLSYEMFIDKYPDYVADLPNRDILTEVIRLHGELYKVSQKPMTKENYIDFLNNNDVDKDNAAKIMPFLIAADILDVHGTIRSDPWHERPLNFAKGFTENAMAVRVDKLIEVYVNEFSNNIIYPWEERQNKKAAHAKWQKIDDYYTEKFYDEITKAKIHFDFLYQILLERREKRAPYYDYNSMLLNAFFKHDPSFDNKLEVANYLFKYQPYYLYYNLDQVAKFFENKKDISEKHRDEMSKLIRELFLQDTQSFTRKFVLSKNSGVRDVILGVLINDPACVELAKDYSGRKVIRKRDKAFYDLIIWLDANRQGKNK